MIIYFVPMLQFIIFSQSISSLPKLGLLTKLHTVQMEGNPVWSSSDYAHYLVSSLPGLKVLDQQEVSQETRANAHRWRQQQQVNGKCRNSFHKKPLVK